MQQTVTRTATSDKWLRFLGWVGLVLLVIEYLFGMLVNLFVSIPSPSPGRPPSTSRDLLQGLIWSLQQPGMPTLLLHVILGLLLILVSLALLVISLIARRGIWLMASLIALIGTIIASSSGANFVESTLTGQSSADASSLVMSLCFLIALIAYAAGLYVTRRAIQSS